MAINLRIPEVDRQRFGLPEWIVYDDSKLMLTDAEVLQSEFGIDPWDLPDELRGRPVLDSTGEPVMVDGKPKLRRNWKAWRFAVWLAAKDAGCLVPFADFDVNIVGLSTGNPDSEAADDPKDPSTPEPDSEPETAPSEG